MLYVPPLYTPARNSQEAWDLMDQAREMEQDRIKLRLSLGKRREPDDPDADYLGALVELYFGLRYQIEVMRVWKQGDEIWYDFKILVDGRWLTIDVKGSTKPNLLHYAGKRIADICVLADIDLGCGIWADYVTWSGWARGVDLHAEKPRIYRQGGRLSHRLLKEQLRPMESLDRLILAGIPSTSC